MKLTIKAKLLSPFQQHQQLLQTMQQFNKACNHIIVATAAYRLVANPAIFSIWAVDLYTPS
jgi:hypothetical protein